jgi:hypothetical protein
MMNKQQGTPKVIVGTVKNPSPSQPYEDWQEANRNPRLGNHYFAHDSSGFPIPVRFCDAQSDGSFHPLQCYSGPLARTWRRPFHSCGVASADRFTRPGISPASCSSTLIRNAP